MAASCGCQTLSSVSRPWDHFVHKNPGRFITDFVTLGTPMLLRGLALHPRPRRVRPTGADGPGPGLPSARGLPDRRGTRPRGWPLRLADPRSHRPEPQFAVRYRAVDQLFPMWWGFFGDWFGGQLRPRFGKGVVDFRSRGTSAVGSLVG